MTPPPPSPPWLLPWLRLALLQRAVMDTRWDAATWPVAKRVLRWALIRKIRLERAGWFN